MNLKFLTPTLIILSLVSLFTDIASEMLYPIIPLYLSTIGYGALQIGMIESISEAGTGLLKAYFGYVADKTGRYTSLVKFGYLLSTVSRVLIGASTFFGTIFAGRFFDRLGKSIRTSPRDSLITLNSNLETRSRAFAFHRSLDSFGVFIGPIITLILMVGLSNTFFQSTPLDSNIKLFQIIFGLTLIPGLIAVGLTFLLPKENPAIAKENKLINRNIFKDYFSYFKSSSLEYKKILFGFFLLAVVNASDMFLILRLKELGISNIMTILSYILYNICLALFSYPISLLINKIGYKYIFSVGLIFYSLAAYLFSQNIGIELIFIAFLLYSIFGSLNQAIATSWVSVNIKDSSVGLGMGLYESIKSLGLLIASLLVGWLWTVIGSSQTFNYISIFLTLVCFYFILFLQNQKLQDLQKPQVLPSCNPRH